jgi:murein DD-endopeptidase MepM/ murein hydrolase activator NlpD
MTTQAKQALPGSNRRTRTSFAVVGLAISMGAYSVPIPNHPESAIAAESPVGEPLPNVSNPLEMAAVSQTADSAPSNPSSDAQPAQIKHTIQDGQTLWTVARFYGIDAALIASANRMSLDETLRVGQVLIIPTDSRLAQTVESSDAPTASPSYYGPVSGQASPDSRQTEQALEAKIRQQKSLEVLRQKGANLRAKLAVAPKRPQVEPPVASSQPNLAVQQPASSLAIQPSLQRQPSDTDASVSTTVRAGNGLNIPTVLQKAQPAAVQPTVPSVLPSAESNSLAYNPAEHSSEQLGGSSEKSAASSHQVSPGETLGSIAKTYGVSVDELSQANRISDPNFIFVDQVLKLPASAQSSSRPYRSIAVLPNIDSATGSAVATVVSPSSTQTSEVATSAPFVGKTTPRSSSSAERLVRYNNVNTLKSEIDQLRDKYRSKAAQNEQADQFVQVQPAVQAQTTRPAQVAVSVTTPAPQISERVNPEFDAQRYSALRGQLRQKLEQSRSTQAVQAPQPSLATRAVSERRQPQVVATAPLGSERYDPLVQAKIGRAVAPDLPSLGTGREYLPGAPGEVAGGYIWPTKGVLTSGYGWRWGRMHRGIDIAGPVGTPIVAAADGVVTYAGWNSGGYGYLVEVQHADGSMTLYAHNDRILVQVGQQVAQGQQISEMGSTGYSTGPHLHFEVHPAGRGAVNPMAMLPRS